MKLLKMADFSAETDLEQRLLQKLFGAEPEAFPERLKLDDYQAELCAAAGDPAARPEEDGKPQERGRPPCILRG